MTPVWEIPNLQIRSTSVIMYQPVPTGFRTENQKITAENLTKTEKYTGVLSPGAKKRITKSIELLIQVARPKTVYFTSKRSGKRKKLTFSLNFITLTIHSTERNITAKEAHRTCLEPLLKWLRDHHNLRCYVWKAELQGRGQIHYHLTTDCFIDKIELNKKWNYLQKKAGYLNCFFQEFGHWQPRYSTDIHSVYKVKDMAAYLKKAVINSCYTMEKNIKSEMAKGQQNEFSVGGKVWDCSENLKCMSYFTTDANPEIVDNLYAQIMKEGNNLIQQDYCTIFTFKNKAVDFMPDGVKIDYENKLLEIYNYKRQPVKNAIENKFEKGINDKNLCVIPLKLEKGKQLNLFSEPLINFPLNTSFISSS